MYSYVWAGQCFSNPILKIILLSIQSQGQGRLHLLATQNHRVDGVGLVKGGIIEAKTVCLTSESANTIPLNSNGKTIQMF